MNGSLVHSLVFVTAASSVAIVFVGVLRKPLRYAVGARAAYWLWLLVPASVVAVWLPAPVHSVRMIAESVPVHARAAFSRAIASVAAVGASPNYTVTGLAIWVLGATLMLTWLLRRQRAFVRSLGDMAPDSDGIYRSRSIVAPLLVGAWRARIVVPTDFEARYSPEERILVLAHERAHAVRRDAAVNVFATVWLCIAWFNPLMYWAVGRLRFDQELACDALVIARSNIGRRRYADALLKAQLANESAWRMPVGCHWQSTHPLKERVAMLRYPSPGLARRLGGIGFTVALTILGSYVVWAAQPEVAMPGTSTTLIAINMKWWVNGADVLQPESPASNRDFLVVSGKEFVRKVSFRAGQSYETRCVAKLPSMDKTSSVWKTAEGFGQRVEGLILLECKLMNDDKVFATPAVLTADSEVATVEVASQDGTILCKLEFNASTLPARTAAAQ
jgi:beta-lactamase regulating signal transducer with metallopeptidase domain